MRWGSIAPERGSTNPLRPIERLPSKANASRETRDGANNVRVTCSATDGDDVLDGINNLGDQRGQLLVREQHLMTESIPIVHTTHPADHMTKATFGVIAGNASAGH
jgi:hypothetical protein